MDKAIAMLNLVDNSSEPPEEPLLVGLPEPPETSDLVEPNKELLSDFSEPKPNEELQTDFPDPHEDCVFPEPPEDSGLPEPPEEPLQSDCCGTGCSPCVFDIYREDLERWKALALLSPKLRAARLLNPSVRDDPVTIALSPREYRTFEVISVKQETSDSFVFMFRLPADSVLGVRLGQHAVLR